MQKAHTLSVCNRDTTVMSEIALNLMQHFTKEHNKEKFDKWKKYAEGIIDINSKYYNAFTYLKNSYK